MHAFDASVAETAAHPEGASEVADDRAVPLPVPRIANARRPRVSVVMPVYNHERFVVDAIQSVLAQTMPDFELIIVDDGSADESMRAVASVDDPRMHVYRLADNQGGAASLNFAIQQARAEFVALLNSDDMWEIRKLERQLAVFDAHPELGAVFTGARFVDEAGNPLPPERIPRWNDIFRQPDRTQAQWLRFFFEQGNALCHPSMLIRRAFYVEHGLYDNRMRQLPDLERWIALVKHYPIVTLGDEDLVRFRLLPSEQNASSVSRANVARGLHEHLAIDEHFFDDVPHEMLVEGFLDRLRNPHIRYEDERLCEIAFLWWDTPCPMQEINRVHALRLFRELLGRPDTALLLQTRYGFDELTLHAFAGQQERTVTPEIEAWLRSFDGMHAPPHPDRAMISEASAGHLLRTLVARARRAKPSTVPHRVVHHMRRALSRD
jgi:glycosyltransferase involved in cell wall biosynthesis